MKERVRWDEDHKEKETDKEQMAIEVLHKVEPKVTEMFTRNVDVDHEGAGEVEEEVAAREKMAVIMVKTRTR